MHSDFPEHIRRVATSGKTALRLLAFAAAFACLSIAHADNGLVVIKSHDIDPYNQALAGFKEMCTKDVTQYNLGGSRDNIPKYSQEIAAAKPKLVLAIGLLAAKMAKDNLKDFQILYIMISNPRKYGLIGNNIAGITLDIPLEIQFRTYRKIMPKMKTVGMIYDPAKSEERIREARAAAEKLGLELTTKSVSSQKDVPEAVRQLLGKIDALLIIPDETVVTAESFKYFLVTTLENKIPFLSPSEIFVEGGALASLTPNFTDVGRQSCELATSLMSGKLNSSEAGASPPRKVDLFLNGKTANTIGLPIPKTILESAKTVYQ
ncbi:MAG: ABC transporter substrate-binding protein [Burkholderiales bacterium]|nr:ABC transporter substrate-binding protein [Burkholderiales bacterium]